MSSAGSWAIWSRRPSDPTNAPGIIFSPGAKPPPHIFRDALDIPTPPPSPPPSLPTELPADNTDTTTATETETEAGTHEHTPLSSDTSVDLNEPTKDENEAKQAEPEPPTPEPTLEPPPPAAPTPAPPKKSWASLLQTPASASASSSSIKRNALPTSAVVGFSIPAARSPVPPSPSPTPSAQSQLPYTKAQRTELLSLLTSGPNATSTSGVADIRPRGLINAGNMCFANSVLQVLAYTPPFSRLFHALGKAGVHLRERDRSDYYHRESNQEKPLLPLVEATVEFVKAFSPRPADEGASLVNGRGKANGYAKGRGGGKGKEREKDRDVGWDEWGTDSFLPNYIFDAMKENKRFDHMHSGQQEDAEEFLGFYLETLEEELLALHQALSPQAAPELDANKQKPGNKPGVVEETLETAEAGDGWLEVGKRNRMVVTRTIKGAESPITRIFGGKFRSTLRAQQQKDSVIVEDWSALRLDIQHDSIHTIQDALAHISSPQPIQLSNPPRPGSQQVLIEALPAVLVVHLKRFCFLAETVAEGETGAPGVGGVVKVGKQVQYGRELIVGTGVMAPGIRRTQEVKYKLFGVVYHHGQSAHGGHYTLDVLHPNRFPKAPSSSSSSSLAPSSPKSSAKPKIPSSSTTSKSSNPASTIQQPKPDSITSIPTDQHQDEDHDPRESWIRIDDELVSDVRPQDVFGYGGSGSQEEGRCAYLLFYRRVR